MVNRNLRRATRRAVTLSLDGVPRSVVCVARYDDALHRVRYRVYPAAEAWPRMARLLRVGAVNRVAHAEAGTLRWYGLAVLFGRARCDLARGRN